MQLIHRRGHFRGEWTPAKPTTGGGLLPLIWYDVSALVGYANGDTVQTLPDLSGNGINATQGTLSSRPKYAESVQGALPALLSDGDRSMVFAGDPFSGAGKWCESTTFVVARQKTLPSWQLVGIASVNSASGCLYSIHYLAANSPYYYGVGSYGGALAGKAYKTGASFAPMAVIRIDSRSLPGSTGEQYVAINGTPVYSVAVNAYWWAIEKAKTAAGLVVSGLSTGAPGTAAQYPIYGWLGELLTYYKDLGTSSDDIAQVEAYLMTKWGITP